MQVGRPRILPPAGGPGAGPTRRKRVSRLCGPATGLGVHVMRCRKSPSIRLRSWSAVALAAGVVALAGCGGGGGHATATPTVVRAPASAASIEQQFERVVRTVSPAVVLIETKSGLGSGVVYDGKGDIVTNAHVVGGARSFRVTLASGDTHKAQLVGVFPAGDLAVIKVEGASPSPAALADSSKLHVGDLALAIGNPLGLRSSVTEGIVSSLGRTVSEGNGVALASAIQTSAPINPGNSGGALVDISGRLIGIPTLAALDPQLGGSQAPGIGFAIPSNLVRTIADQLIANGKVVRTGRAYLGVSVTTVTNGGVLVAKVVRGGPAAAAGIRPGDLIVSVDGKPTPNADVLTTVLAALRPRQVVPVTVLRSGGRRTTVKVTLGELPGG
jgi:putative serine protease PepD